MVVANKSDLSVHTDFHYDSLEATVIFDWENGYVESSAKERRNINKIFKELLNQSKPRYGVSIAAASSTGNGNTAQHPRLQRLLSLQQKAGKKPSNGHGQSGGCCIESDQLLKRRQSLPITPQKNSANSSCANVPDVIAEEEGGAKITGLQNSGNCSKTKTTPKRRSSFPALRRNSCKVS